MTAAEQAAAEAEAPARGWIDYAGCLRWNAGDPAEGAACIGCGRTPAAGQAATAEAPPHPRARFDMYGSPPPPEPWGYDLDDNSGVRYCLARTAPRAGRLSTYHPVRGAWWPYQRDDESRPSVRLAPDAAYYAWRNHYVLAGPVDHEWAEVSLHLYVGQQGMGAIVVDARLRLHLPTGRMTVQPEDVTGDLLAQAEDRGRRVAEFITAERQRANTPPYPPRPVTAHEKYTAASTDRAGG